MGFAIHEGGHRKVYDLPNSEASAAPSGRAASADHRSAQIMVQPVVSAHPDMSVSEVQQVFRQHRFRHLPVLTISGSLAGMVSDRDILPVAPGQEAGWVLHVMSKKVLTASPDTPLRDVARVMAAERISALPVLDGQGLVGIVTTSDLLRCIVHEGPVELWA